MSQTNSSLSIGEPHPANTTAGQKIALSVVSLGILALLVSWASMGKLNHPLFFGLVIGGLSLGGIWYFIQKYLSQPEGIKNNGTFFKSESSRGIIGWIMGIVITGFYVFLYWYPQFIEGLIRMMDPLSEFLRGMPADQWFTYGAFYTIAIIVMGTKFIFKYRHNRYQQIRTLSVTFFQLAFAFLLPIFLVKMNEPEYYFSYFWPLDYNGLWPSNLTDLKSHPGKYGAIFFMISGIMALVAVPVLTYFFGKRWYCSWVCGCGGLAETAGDPWRHLSDKSITSWKIERWMIHVILLIITLLTIVLIINSALEGQILGGFSNNISKWYAFGIGSVFSGVVGVGFYPIMGSRVWCRFGCPQAAILGIIQKFKSRFRITTNGGQCISCGNCSTYCEMGIDVKWYAQRGQNIVRASCVGCGICSAVCPRGVLRLENGKDENRKSIQAFKINGNGIKLNDTAGVFPSI